MSVYIFVVAAVLAVIPILILVKINVNKLIADPQQLNSVQKRFFVGVALSKIIPVVLLIYGIVKLTPVTDYSELYIPWSIILATVLFGLYYITSQNRSDVGAQEKVAINTLITIARPLIFSIPLMAAIFLFMMTVK